MPRRKPRLPLEPFAATAAIIWGSSYPATQIALRGLSPFAAGFWRTLVGLVFLALVSFGFGASPIHPRRLRLAQWWRLSLLSLLSTAIFLTFLNLSIQQAGPVMAAFLVTTYPVFALLLAPWVVHEPVLPRRTVAALVSIGGAFLLLGGSHSLGGQASAQAVLGGGLGLGASLSFALYLVLTRRWTHAFDLDARTIAFFSPVFSAPVMLPLALLAGHGGLGINRLDSGLAVLWLGILCSGLAYLAMNHSLRRGQASRSSMPLLLAPVVASLLSWLILGVHLSALQWLGAAISLAGMFAANL
ncbi:MAG TPA: DMT family transporter [Chloroflexota bacterium]|nr:DMT family transporter [Chloroflexota bacterium]